MTTPPIIGLIATLAPTVGPTIGGYVTDALSWHWLFFINIAPGLIVTLPAYLLIDFDKPDYSLLENFDWWGLISMAGFLGALEYILEEGPRYGWFDDGTITLFAVISAVSAIAFFIRVFTARAPIVDYRLAGAMTAGHVIERLRASYGPELPALVITGNASVAAVRERLPGLPIAVKPVPPGRLRAFLSQTLTGT